MKFEGRCLLVKHLTLYSPVLSVIYMLQTAGGSLTQCVLQ